jgi:hypothetical protein
MYSKYLPTAFVIQLELAMEVEGLSDAVVLLATDDGSSIEIAAIAAITIAGRTIPGGDMITVEELRRCAVGRASRSVGESL